MAILKAEYGASGTEWWLDVTHVRAAHVFSVTREHLKDPYRALGEFAHQEYALSTGDDPEIMYGARVAMPHVISSGCFHPFELDDELSRDGKTLDALLLVVESKNEPEPFGVIVRVGRWYLMNDNGDTIDRI